MNVHLELLNKEYGPNHPNIASCVNNMGLVLQDMGDLQGAKEFYEQALRIDKKEYGPNHPNMATLLNNLGLVLQKMEDLLGAQEHIGRALEIFRQSLGEEHPKTVAVRENLASLKWEFSQNILSLPRSSFFVAHV